MKTYFVTYTNLDEESVEATSLRITSNVISFLKNESVSFVVPVAQIMRIGLSRLPQIDFNEDVFAAPTNPTSGRGLKSYWVTYSRTGQEECINAASINPTSKLVSFVEDGAVTFVVPVSEIIRLGENKFSPLAEPEVERERAEKLQSVRAWLERHRQGINGKGAEARN